MIRFLIFLYLYSIIYTFATIKFSSYFLLTYFSRKICCYYYYTFQNLSNFFCEIRTYFHGISVNFMVKYVKDAF